MTEHVTTVEPIDRGVFKQPPAYRYVCTCGTAGPKHTAHTRAPAKVREARDAAITDGIAHRKEAERRGY